ncbi:formyltransferase family protein [Salinimicrobium sp. WS361]|uniref:formyltransferase family protein n=1 Tax=Salinimicrobium sp. WS361 TaxID=3425123 RepID=UPI003D6F9F06
MAYIRTVLLTSNSLRHKYIAHCLASKLDLALIVTEQKSSRITETGGYNEDEALFIRQHFIARETSEKKYFGEYSEFPSNIPLLEVEHGEINSSQVVKTIEKVTADYIVLFGTSIIKDQLLEKYSGRIINLHLGLSPYYRGSATNLFPYFFGEPECIGGTFHLATAEVDKGEILHQFRPDISPDDNLHDIGNKVILKGGEILPEILKDYEVGKIIPEGQKGSGKICRNKDLSPEVLRDIYRSFDAGLIEEYLADKRIRNEAKPIISNYAN